MPGNLARAVLASTVLAACEPSAVLLVVDLRTDLVADELDTVRTVVLDAAGATVREASYAATGDEDFLAGARIAELEGLASGTYRVQVEVSRAGTQVATQTIVVTLDADRSVTILLTRDCVGVTCTDESALACLGGACVDPECVFGEGCAAECAVDGDCATPDPCVVASCVAGACFLRADDAGCDAGGYCDFDAGCSDPSAGLLAHWTMDGALDPIGDAVGPFAAACMPGECASAVPGRVGMAARFEPGDCHRAPHDPALEAVEAITVAAFVRLREVAPPGSYATAIGKVFGDGSLNSFILYYSDEVDGTATEDVYFAINDATQLDRAASRRAFEADEWAHVAGRFAGGFIELYFDGVIVGTFERPGPLSWDAGAITIGCDENSGSPTTTWPGDLDDVRVYGRALTAREIRALAGQP